MAKVELRLVIGAIVLIFAIFLFNSCSLSRGTLIFTTQDYWWYAFGSKEELFSDLKDIAQKNMMRFKLKTLSKEKSNSELSGLFQNSSDSIVILDPVLTLKYLRMKEEEKSKDAIGKIFMILGNKLKTVKIEYTRDAALETAGRICGDMINGKLYEKASNCVFIYIDNNSNGKKNLSDFKRGFNLFTGENMGEKILVGRLSNSVNRTRAKRIFDNYSSDPNNIYILMTYSLTSFFLDLIAKRGGFAVIMDPLKDFEYGNVIFSIKYDFSDGIEKALQVYFEKNNIFSVVSSAYIEWGKNYPIPDNYGEESIIVR